MSLAWPAYRYILFHGENILFDANLVIYTNSTNIPSIMIVNTLYESQKASVAVACFLPGRAKDLSAPLYNVQYILLLMPVSVWIKYVNFLIYCVYYVKFIYI